MREGSRSARGPAGGGGNMTALTALPGEHAMLRQHAARGRRRAAPRPRQQWRAIDRFWAGGYEQAMREVIGLAGEAAGRTDQPRAVLAAVLDLATAVVEIGVAE